jgi:hypothetical protein
MVVAITLREEGVTDTARSGPLPPLRDRESRLS